MSTIGNHSRKIQVVAPDMDAFSDDIKIGGLIDEIEAAEAKAKKALLARQIKESQPSVISQKIKNLGQKVFKQLKTIKANLKDFTIKAPQDPIFNMANKKHVITVKSHDKVAKIKVKRLTQKVQKAQKTQKTISLPKLSLISKINSLAPNGVSRRNLVTVCIGAVAIVTAAELGIWAFTHPYSTETKVQEVPKTGITTDVTSDEVEPTITPAEQSAENTETQAPQTTQNTTTRQTTTNRTTTVVKKTTSNTTSSNTVYVDSQLTDDNELVDFPEPQNTQEEQKEQLPAEEETKIEETQD